MRIRPLLFVAAALAAAACSNPAEPMLACDGNPKCEANPLPVSPSELLPLSEAPNPAPGMDCRIRIAVRCG